MVLLNSCVTPGAISNRHYVHSELQDLRRELLQLTPLKASIQEVQLVIQNHLKRPFRIYENPSPPLGGKWDAKTENGDFMIVANLSSYMPLQYFFS